MRESDINVANRVPLLPNRRHNSENTTLISNAKRNLPSWPLEHGGQPCGVAGHLLLSVIRKRSFPTLAGYWPQVARTLAAPQETRRTQGCGPRDLTG